MISLVFIIPHTFSCVIFQDTLILTFDVGFRSSLEADNVLFCRREKYDVNMVSLPGDKHIFS